MFSTTTPTITSTLSTFHLKGFAGRIHGDHTDDVVAFIKEHNFSHLVFDGDLPSEGSYVNTIKGVCEQLPRLKIIAYRKESELDSFRLAWMTSQVWERIELRSAPDSLNWDELGIYALKDTGAKHVLCVGGGETVRKEHEASSAEVTWHIIDAVRNWNYETELKEHCSLLYSDLEASPGPQGPVKVRTTATPGQGSYILGKILDTELYFRLQQYVLAEAQKIDPTVQLDGPSVPHSTWISPPMLQSAGLNLDQFIGLEMKYEDVMTAYEAFKRVYPDKRVSNMCDGCSAKIVGIRAMPKQEGLVSKTGVPIETVQAIVDSPDMTVCALAIRLTLGLCETLTDELIQETHNNMHTTIAWFTIDILDELRPIQDRIWQRFLDSVDVGIIEIPFQYTPTKLLRLNGKEYSPLQMPRSIHRLLTRS